MATQYPEFQHVGLHVCSESHGGQRQSSFVSAWLDNAHPAQFELDGTVCILTGKASNALSMPPNMLFRTSKLSTVLTSAPAIPGMAML